MKSTKTIYWIFTILFCLAILFTAINELINPPSAHDFMAKLGYPLSINPFLAVAKILGIIALLVPGFPKIKEWAYAGFAFDLIGATYAQIAAGMASAALTFMLVFFVLLFGSYIFYHKKLLSTTKAVLTN